MKIFGETDKIIQFSLVFSQQEGTVGTVPVQCSQDLAWKDGIKGKYNKQIPEEPSTTEIEEL